MSRSALKSTISLLGAVPNYYQPFVKQSLPVLVTAVRYKSDGLWSVPLKKEKVSDKLQLHTIQGYSAPGVDSRPLVLLFGWMLAKQRHLDKYANLYHSKGFDVLTLQTKPQDVLRPTHAQATIEQLLGLLTSSQLAHKPLMLHGFSVGGYMYGEMLVKLRDNRDKWGDVGSRMVGQIFDSPVDFEGIPSGFSNILLKNGLAQKLMEASLTAYCRLPVADHYRKSSQAFHENELSLPSLILYSRADPIGVDTRIEEVMGKWKAKGLPVSSRCWESSPHVSHFHRHPDEYVEMVLNFLDAINLSRPEHETAQVKKPEVKEVKRGAEASDSHERQSEARV